MGITYLLLVFCSLFVSLHYKDCEGAALAGAIMSGSVITLGLFWIIEQDWNKFNFAILLVDLTLLAAFTMIAMKSAWRWTMIVCSMQFVVTASHVAAVVGDSPATRSLGVVQGIWAYIQCTIIMFGVIYKSKRVMTDRK